MDHHKKSHGSNHLHNHGSRRNSTDSKGRRKPKGHHDEQPELFDIASTVPEHALKSRRHMHQSDESQHHNRHSQDSGRRPSLNEEDSKKDHENRQLSHPHKGKEEDHPQINKARGDDKEDVGPGSSSEVIDSKKPEPIANKKFPMPVPLPKRTSRVDPLLPRRTWSDPRWEFDIIDEEEGKEKNNYLPVLAETEEDKQLGEQLSEIMDGYRNDEKKQARKGKKNRYPKYTYSEIVAMLTKQGIPVPTDADFARLEATHGTKWDPDGTIVEYYSPVLRSFIPVNMRGRYRGCWAEDRCIQGLDVSKIGPKPDALEGFVDRSRQERIQLRYDVMGGVATDEGHLDYLLELQKYQTEILPIPIFYDVLNLGMETLNENLKILATEEGYPPSDRIYQTTEEQARHVRRKLQVYAGLGLEPLHSNRKGLGRMHPQWAKTRDEIINSLFERRQQAQYMMQMKRENENAAKAQAEQLNEAKMETEKESKDADDELLKTESDAKSTDKFQEEPFETTS